MPLPPIQKRELNLVSPEFFDSAFQGWNVPTVDSSQDAEDNGKSSLVEPTQKPSFHPTVRNPHMDYESPVTPSTPLTFVSEHYKPENLRLELPEPEVWTEEARDAHDPKIRSASRHPAGRFFGRSLLDDAEERKTQLKSRQKAFQGDNRRKMMAVPALDAQKAAERPQEEESDDEPLLKRYSRMPNSKIVLPPKQSVFGVDRIMERELVKLEKILQIEAAEQAVEAEKQRIKDEKQRIKDEKHRAKQAKKEAAKRPKSSATARSMQPIQQQNPHPAVFVAPPALNYHRRDESPELLLLTSRDSKCSTASEDYASTEPESDDSSEPLPAELPHILGLDIVAVSAEKKETSWFEEMEKSSSDEDDAPTGLGTNLDAYALPPPSKVASARRQAKLVAKGKISLDPGVTADGGGLGLDDFLAADTSSSDEDNEDLPQHTVITRRKMKKELDPEPDSEDDIPLGIKMGLEEDEDVPLGQIHPAALARQEVEIEAAEQAIYAEALRQQQQAFAHIMAQQQAMFQHQILMKANQASSTSMLSGAASLPPPPSDPRLANKIDSWRQRSEVERERTTDFLGGERF